MPRLLVNSVEGAKLIPFAKGRLRALRAAGHTNITQRYEVRGISVRVTINGAEEVIEIVDTPWDYLVWPTSTTHPDGVREKDGETVPPVASMKLTSSEKGIKRKEHSKLEAGPHDWISADAKVSLSYDHGHGFRYALTGGYESFTGSPWICRNGKRTPVEFGVKGAAVFKHTAPDGAVTRRVVYASYGYSDAGADLLVLYWLDESDKDADGMPRSKEFARWFVPEGFVIAQPTFFDGLGAKAVTVLDKFTMLGLPPSQVYSYGGPRKVVRIAIDFSPASGMSATFSTAALPATPDAPTSTTNEVRKDPGDPSWAWGSTTRETFNTSRTESGAYPGPVTITTTVEFVDIG